MDTGFPSSDAQFDYSRARRRQVLARLAARLRGQPSDVNLILPFDEVVEALGYVGERSLGLQSIELDTIVGTVGRGRDFDRSFRPVSGRTRTRWERIANAQRRGQDMPPISVYRIGDLHFVRDGHHRVSVARALGLTQIDAYVTEVQTKIGADSGITLADLPVKSHVRLFYERVPLPYEARDEVKLSEPMRYAELAEGVEAWGFRSMQGRGELLDRSEVAEAWLTEEYRPVVRMLREAELTGDGTDADAYLHIAGERFRLLLTHEWSDAVIDRLRRELD
ncbi:MAG: hypothetical protein QOJ07_3852 [Thermoleophilaceae bacterium]|nr:hypothetical protein [Thermoleophilaceae bacterium]